MVYVYCGKYVFLEKSPRLKEESEVEETEAYILSIVQYIRLIRKLSIVVTTCSSRSKTFSDYEFSDFEMGAKTSVSDKFVPAVFIIPATLAESRKITAIY